MPPWRLVGVPPQVRAEARGADEVHDGISWAFRVGKVEGTRHGLKTEGVVVNVQRCERNGFGALLCGPLGGRLDSIKHM